VNGYWYNLVLDNTKAIDIDATETVQELWSGYGEIIRVTLVPNECGTVIVKLVDPPDFEQHPRGWNTNASYLRKVRSYDVEQHWYSKWSSHCDINCRIPAFIASHQVKNQRVIVLEDLDAAGFSIRYSRLDFAKARYCIRWLANFHARHLNIPPDGLWPVGTYWHLATRSDEYNAMQPGNVKDKAQAIDALLNNCVYRTVVHGDAKVANFCFSEDSVAAVDFQYVGGGCGMKDVAYFFGSCFTESECELWVPELLNEYFEILTNRVDSTKINTEALEKEWRSLFAPAWTDFYRFLLGWMPDHKKINRYTEALARDTLRQV